MNEWFVCAIKNLFLEIIYNCALNVTYRKCIVGVLRFFFLFFNLTPQFVKVDPITLEMYILKRNKRRWIDCIYSSQENEFAIFIFGILRFLFLFCFVLFDLNKNQILNAFSYNKWITQAFILIVINRPFHCGTNLSSINVKVFISSYPLPSTQWKWSQLTIYQRNKRCKNGIW